MTGNIQKITALLNHMTPMGEAPPITAFRKAVEETGGTYVVPQAGDRTGSHLVELALYGITASGRDELEAILSWKRIAQHLLNAKHDPDPVADVTLQVTTLDKAGNIGTVQVLIDGNTPAHNWLQAAALAMVRQTHIEGQTIAKISIIGFRATTPVSALDVILRDYNDGQTRECA